MVTRRYRRIEPSEWVPFWFATQPGTRVLATSPDGGRLLLSIPFKMQDDAARCRPGRVPRAVLNELWQR